MREKERAGGRGRERERERKVAQEWCAQVPPTTHNALPAIVSAATVSDGVGIAVSVHIDVDFGALHKPNATTFYLNKSKSFWGPRQGT